MPPQIVMRHRPTQFGHIFSSDDYSAGYYVYTWAQVLDNDGFAAFEEAGDIFDPATAKRFHDEILVRGNTRDVAESYRAFRGRDPKIDATDAQPRLRLISLGHGFAGASQRLEQGQDIGPEETS